MEANILELYTNYGTYKCKVGELMDKYHITLSKMHRLTGINYEIVKKYYNDDVVRMDKDVLSRITYVLVLYGADPKDLLEYIPPKKDNSKK